MSRWPATRDSASQASRVAAVRAPCGTIARSTWSRPRPRRTTSAGLTPTITASRLPSRVAASTACRWCRRAGQVVARRGADAVRGREADPAAGFRCGGEDFPVERGILRLAQDDDRRDPGGRADREQHPGNGTGGVAGLALGYRPVNVEPRTGVDLADRAAGFPVWPGRVGRDEVDTADVDPEQAGGALGDLPDRIRGCRR